MMKKDWETEGSLLTNKKTKSSRTGKKLQEERKMEKQDIG